MAKDPRAPVGGDATAALGWHLLSDPLREALKVAPVEFFSPDIVRNNYQRWRGLFPEITTFFALKSCPEAAQVLMDEGGSFDVASAGEIRKLQALGVDGTKMLYSNTSASPYDLAVAAAAGVDRFVVHSKDGIESIKEHVPGAKIIVRVCVDGGDDVEFPHKGRFGVESTEEALALIELAKTSGLQPLGIHTHHGSENRDSKVWKDTIISMTEFIKRVKADYPTLRVLDISGGFAGPGGPDMEEYALTINSALEEAKVKEGVLVSMLSREEFSQVTPLIFLHVYMNQEMPLLKKTVM